MGRGLALLDPDLAWMGWTRFVFLGFKRAGTAAGAIEDHHRSSRRCAAVTPTCRRRPRSVTAIMLVIA